MDVEGKVAVVTGAASGMGLGMARTFTTNGMRVVLADIEQAPLDEAVAELATAGHDVIGVLTDVADLKQVLEREGLGEAEEVRWDAYLRVDPRDLAQFRVEERDSNRRMLRVISGSALFFSGALLIGLKAGPWYLFEASVPGLVSMVVGVWLLIRGNSQFRRPD